MWGVWDEYVIIFEKRKSRNKIENQFMFAQTWDMKVRRQALAVCARVEYVLKKKKKNATAVHA